MRKYSKFIVVAGALAAVALPSTAMAADGGTATYAGQGFTAGVLNNQPSPANDGNTGQFANWDGPGDAYDAGDGYLLWVLPANGATEATITLPDGKTEKMIPVGGTFKYASPYYSYKTLTEHPPTATYTGTVKGNVKLTASHGHAVDTNIPANNWNATDGGTVAGDFGPDPAFAYKKTHNNNYSWQCSNGDVHTSVQHLVYTWQVDATPILGDVTGKIVGYQLTKTAAAGPAENYRTGTPQGTCPNGDSFVQWMYGNPSDPNVIWTPTGTMRMQFVDNIASGLIVNGEWLKTTG